ncbi:hypothetical protein QZM26_29315 [Burkholderia multivorans]|nr:hypothetical protein [Burkholderia multivorans]
MKNFHEHTPEEQVVIVAKELKRYFDYSNDLKDELKVNNLALWSLMNKVQEYSTWNYRLWAFVVVAFFVGFLMGKI